MKKTASPKPAAQKPRTASAVLVLPTLAEIVDRLGDTHGRIAKAREAFEKATLADYVWIGVCCLAAQEHHAIPVAEALNRKGKGKNQNRVTRDTISATALTTHPQGFTGWLSLAMPDLQRVTAYKYITAAKGAGFNAYSTETEVRQQIAAWLADWEERHGKPLTLAALVAQGKTVDPGGEGNGENPPPGPSIDKVKYETIRIFEAHTTQLAALRPHLTPEEHEVITNKLANTLHEITGYEWHPVTKSK